MKSSLLQEMISRVKENPQQDLFIWEEMAELLGVTILIFRKNPRHDRWGYALGDRDGSGIVLFAQTFEVGEEFLNDTLAHEFAHCLTPGAGHGVEFIDMFENISRESYERERRLSWKCACQIPKMRKKLGLLGLIFHRQESQPAGSSSDRG